MSCCSGKGKLSVDPYIPKFHIPQRGYFPGFDPCCKFKIDPCCKERFPTPILRREVVPPPVLPVWLVDLCCKCKCWY